MATIFISGEIPKIGNDILSGHEVHVFPGEKLITEDELIEGVRHADALICPLSTKVTRKVIESAPNLKVIANFGAGFDNIDIQAAKERNIPVSNTPGVSTEATAELTLGLMLALARRIPEGDTLCRTTGFNGWAPLFFLGRELTNKKLGIVGFGNIGQSVAKRAKAFDMDIYYTGRSQKDAAIEEKYNATYVTFEELVETCDVISVHTAYNKDTHHLFTKDVFAKMKKEAFFLNLARGPVVKEADLVEALKEGDIAGAALDVYEFEPEITGDLKQLQNVVLTPHIGNATIETRDAMATLAAKNVINVLDNKGALTPVW
ncbi:2-hydroxyacid dehydrogenase family protein [Ornithinibacillus halotolerans]|uniref:Glycerate dehydrogenase n=1 Tax=Ornithinibacillus halotolerans TaxID=1274357 RepID=A0A916S2M6_9BACI|nr:2-hydroxyacid dehydrogenase family protein [Ornithinibacillus halotolerans]GGA79104.1 glycerate dehydrogenase [Ornithinibacillus halotolerans]